MATKIDEKLVEKLKRTGLTGSEAKVYATVLASQGAYPSAIADVTGVNRSSVYKTLTTLEVRGLVSVIEKGKKLYYQAEKPSKLLRATEYQKQIADDAFVRAKEILPELEGMYSGADNKPNVAFYEGYERVVEAYMTHVDVDKRYDMRCFLSTIDLKSFLGYKKFRAYIKAKERIGIPVRMIAPQSEETKKFSQEMFSGIKKPIWPNIRTVSKEMFTFPAEITLYDNNKVSIVKFEKENPVAVIITDQTIYDMMGMLFELIWKHAKPLV